MIHDVTFQQVIELLAGSSRDPLLANRRNLFRSSIRRSPEAFVASTRGQQKGYRVRPFHAETVNVGRRGAPVDDHLD